MSYRIEKYRPYLTLDDLELCAAGVRLLPEVPLILMTYLDRYIVDIKLKTRQASVLTRPTIAQTLEVDTPVKKPNDPNYNAEILYDVYVSNKNSYTGMNATQIKLVKEHMLQFMSPEEMHALMTSVKINPETARINAGLPPEEGVL